MYLQRFSHQGIRNLSAGQLELGARLNIFFGDNGAGKSSILEAISLLTSGRSFRCSKLELVVNRTPGQLIVFGKTSDEQRLGLGFELASKKKSIKLNGERQSRLSSLTKLFPTQVLSPESYGLIDGGPNERRKYLDWCLFHVEHSYHHSWKSYVAILKQRNALLRQSKGKIIAAQLAPWDLQLCEHASAIQLNRKAVLERLQVLFDEVMTHLNVDLDGEVTLSYYPGYAGELKDKLLENINLDSTSGFTRSGPHKADLRIKVNGQLARDVLSRGQKKLLINALYLAQTRLLESQTQGHSLFIIDDFSSELDSTNQIALLETLLGQDRVQIILSCLQLDSLNWLKTRYNRANMFHVEHGNITPLVNNETS